MSAKCQKKECKKARRQLEVARHEIRRLGALLIGKYMLTRAQVAGDEPLEKKEARPVEREERAEGIEPTD